MNTIVNNHGHPTPGIQAALKVAFVTTPRHAHESDFGAECAMYSGAHMGAEVVTASAPKRQFNTALGIVVVGAVVALGYWMYTDGRGDMLPSFARKE